VCTKLVYKCVTYIMSTHYTYTHTHTHTFTHIHTHTHTHKRRMGDTVGEENGSTACTETRVNYY